MVRQYVKRVRKYRETHPDVKAVTVYNNDEYEQVFRDIFFSSQHEFEMYRNGLFGRPDFKDLLENYFNIKL